MNQEISRNLFLALKSLAQNYTFFLKILFIFFAMQDVSFYFRWIFRRDAFTYKGWNFVNKSMVKLHLIWWVKFSWILLHSPLLPFSHVFSVPIPFSFLDPSHPSPYHSEQIAWIWPYWDLIIPSALSICLAGLWQGRSVFTEVSIFESWIALFPFFPSTSTHSSFSVGC